MISISGFNFSKALFALLSDRFQRGVEPTPGIWTFRHVVIRRDERLLANVALVADEVTLSVQWVSGESFWQGAVFIDNAVVHCPRPSGHDMANTEVGIKHKLQVIKFVKILQKIPRYLAVQRIRSKLWPLQVAIVFSCMHTNIWFNGLGISVAKPLSLQKVNQR